MRTTVILYMLLASLTVLGRVAYLAHARLFEKIDTSATFNGTEMELAAASLARNGFIGQIYNNSASGESTARSAHVAPLYVFLLAALYRLFGWNTIAGRLAQETCAIAATTLGIALLPSLARTARLSVTAGWVAAYALAILPINLWVEASGTWEQPYSTLFLLGLFAMFCRLHDQRWQDSGTVVLTGVLLGLMALLSPSLLPAGVLMIVAELITQGTYHRRVVLGSVAIVFSAGVVVAPWIVRNYYALGGFVPIRSNFGLELALGNNPHANGRTVGTTLEDPNNLFNRYHPFSNGTEMSRLLEIGERPYMREKQAIALRWMREHPAKAVELIGRRFQVYWFPPKDMWGPSSPGRRLKAAIMSIIGLATLICLVCLIRDRHDRAWLLAATVFGASFVYLITHVDVRYRYPISGISTLLTLHLGVRMWQRIGGSSYWHRSTLRR